VVDDPEPSVVFTLFGDNSLNLALRCFISSVDDRMPVTTDLHREINNRFNDAGLVIAFPQRDVHLDSSQPIRISLEGTALGGSDAS
jgi:potassium efflux system protein